MKLWHVTQPNHRYYEAVVIAETAERAIELARASEYWDNVETVWEAKEIEFKEGLVAAYDG
jgi:hypothetical protein